MPGATSTLVAAPIWQAFMQTALEGKPVVNFEVPAGIEFADVCAATGEAPGRDCPKVVKEVFLAGHTPKGAKASTSAATSTPPPQPTATAPPPPPAQPPPVQPTPALPIATPPPAFVTPTP